MKMVMITTMMTVIVHNEDNNDYDDKDDNSMEIRKIMIMRKNYKDHNGNDNHTDVNNDIELKHK